MTRYRTDNKLPTITIQITNVKELMDSFFVPRTISQKRDLLLKYISKKSEIPGTIIEIDVVSDYPVAFCRNYQEMDYYLEQLESQDLIERFSTGHSYKITLEGWNRIEENEKKMVKKKQAFIDIWFDESMSEFYENGFRKAIIDCGYEPMKIDLKEHNNKIDDEIIAEIRNSGFLIADFTGHRGGVYFEAGFAKGLDIPVIWTCKSCDLKDSHFDTRQYNHIEWDTVEDIYKKLFNRIKATITI